MGPFFQLKTMFQLFMTSNQWARRLGPWIDMKWTDSKALQTLKTTSMGHAFKWIPSQLDSHQQPTSSTGRTHQHLQANQFSLALPYSAAENSLYLHIKRETSPKPSPKPSCHGTKIGVFLEASWVTGARSGLRLNIRKLARKETVTRAIWKSLVNINEERQFKQKARNTSQHPEFFAASLC